MPAFLTFFVFCCIAVILGRASMDENGVKSAGCGTPAEVGLALRAMPVPLQQRIPRVTAGMKWPKIVTIKHHHPRTPASSFNIFL